MTAPPVAPIARVHAWLRGSSSMNRVERAAFLALLLVGIGVSVVSLIIARDEGRTGALFELMVTALFALYLWSAAAATVSLGAAMILSFSADLPQQTLLAFAIAAICVVRTGTPALMLGYAAALVVATVAVAHESASGSASAVGFLIVALVLGGISLLLRAAQARGEHLDTQLEQSQEREKAAAALERRRLAGDLHDGIAHDLTVIALHAQMLDDDDVEVRRTAHNAIRVTAHNALGDLRYLIEIAEDGPRDAPGFSADPAVAVREAAETLEAAGYPVTVEVDDLPRAPRRVGVVFARVLRECVTNVLKHAGPGPVHVAVHARGDRAELTMRNALPAARRHDLPSAGTGVARMADRVRDFGGELHTRIDEGEWVVEVGMPLP